MNQGQYGLTHIVFFQKKNWSIFVKSRYGSNYHINPWNYVVFSDISTNFRSRCYTTLTILSFQELYITFDQALFFLLQIYLKNTNQEKYGLTHNYPFTKIWPILSKTRMARIALHLLKYLAKIWKKIQSWTIRFNPDCTFRKNWSVFIKNSCVSICTFFDKF